MATTKGTLGRIADAVGGAVQAAAAGAGLVAGAGPEATRKVPKSARKAGQKAAVARVERADPAARRAAGRRVGS